MSVAYPCTKTLVRGWPLATVVVDLFCWLSPGYCVYQQTFVLILSFFTQPKVRGCLVLSKDLPVSMTHSLQICNECVTR